MTGGAKKERILGIDPGLADTGWGVVEIGNGAEKALDYGVVKTSKDLPLAERLNLIHKELKDIMANFSPLAVAVEDIYFSKNVKTAIIVAEARGVILMTAAEAGVPVFPYTPLQVKQALVGYGRAEKAQVQKMLAAILKLKEYPKPDHAADALAIALCHAHSLKRKSLLTRAGVDETVALIRSTARRKRTRFYK